MSTKTTTTTTTAATAGPAASPAASGHGRLIATRDPGTASAVLAKLYAGNDFELGRPAQDFHFQMSVHTAGQLMVSLARYGAQGRAHAAPVDTFVANLLTAGSMTITAGAQRGRVLQRGQLWRWDNQADLRMAFDAESAFANIQLPFSLIEEVAARRNASPAAGVRFLTNGALDPAAERYWKDLTTFAVAQARTLEPAPSNPLLRQHVVETLAAAALAVFPNTTMTTDYLPGPGQVGPATVRRAVAHAHAHAAQPLTVTDLAVAAGIGVRALQAAFVQHLGQPPMTYLRQVRLQRAHQELRAADPRTADTVAAVATRWGFTHPGRFAAAYRARYGTSPAATLRS